MAALIMERGGRSGDRGKAAMRFVLKTLALNDEPVQFSYAVLDLRLGRIRSSWSGIVRGGLRSSLMDLGTLRLEADTDDGRRLTGQVVVPTMNFSTDSFTLQGSGPLLVDGQIPAV